MNKKTLNFQITLISQDRDINDNGQETTYTVVVNDDVEADGDSPGQAFETALLAYLIDQQSD